MNLLDFLVLVGSMVGIAAYGAWHLAFGQAATHVTLQAGSLASLVAFVASGLGAAVKLRGFLPEAERSRDAQPIADEGDLDWETRSRLDGK